MSVRPSAPCKLPVAVKPVEFQLMPGSRKCRPVRHIFCVEVRVELKWDNKEIRFSSWTWTLHIYYRRRSGAWRCLAARLGRTRVLCIRKPSTHTATRVVSRAIVRIICLPACSENCRFYVKQNSETEWGIECAWITLLCEGDWECRISSLFTSKIF